MIYWKSQFYFNCHFKKHFLFLSIIHKHHFTLIYSIIIIDNYLLTWLLIFWRNWYTSKLIWNLKLLTLLYLWCILLLLNVIISIIIHVYLTGIILFCGWGIWSIIKVMINLMIIFIIICFIFILFDHFFKNILKIIHFIYHRCFNSIIIVIVHINNIIVIS